VALGFYWSSLARENLIRIASEALRASRTHPGQTFTPLSPHLRTCLCFNPTTGLIEVSFPGGWVPDAPLEMTTYLPVYLDAQHLASDYFYREMNHSPAGETVARILDPSLPEK
jgi:hypothetical protein